jgi:ATP-dependent Clp protease ATP-binding subunit ClpC
MTVLEGAAPALRDVLVRADAESRRLRHGYLGSEHLLLGLLLLPDGRAARRLAQAGVDHAAAVARVLAVVGTDEEPASSGPLPFTPRAVEALRRVERETERLGHEAIGTEHVLRALLRTRREGLARRVLLDLGVDVSGIAAELRRPRADVP